MTASAPSQRSTMRGSQVRKAFVTLNTEIEETVLQLDRAAFVEAYDRQIKEDNVHEAMARKANIPGNWTTRRLEDPNSFFVACPSHKVVHRLMTGGRIKGNGFSLQVNHWDPFRAAIVSSFGLPHRASKACLKWDDLTSFDLDLFCEAIEDVPDYVNVSVGDFMCNIQIRVNFVSEFGPQGSISFEGSPDNEDEDWDYWFGPGEKSPQPPSKKRPATHLSSSSSRRQTSCKWVESSEELKLQLVPQATQLQLSAKNFSQNNFWASTFTRVFILKPTLWINPSLIISLGATRSEGIADASDSNGSLPPPSSLAPSSEVKNQTLPSQTGLKPRMDSVAFQPVPIKRVFSRLLSSFENPYDFSTEQHLSDNPSSFTPPCTKLEDSSIPVKWSARIWSKKIKSLILIEDSLMAADVLFLNSLTAAQIADMGKKCGLIFEHW
ncbi:hypothetical protein COCNU_02G007750 [Cocos nucifera]|uniref:Uncharacterized protein n=1 Tax=Cocos nucifera TaxID=13894 RepID=A0A8K0HZN9_COCNU|nr:hypothetical protein COCNU_02G007750 [Cocos nucifera]